MGISKCFSCLPFIMMFVFGQRESKSTSNKRTIAAESEILSSTGDQGVSTRLVQDINP